MTAGPGFRPAAPGQVFYQRLNLFRLGRKRSRRAVSRGDLVREAPGLRGTVQLAGGFSAEENRAATRKGFILTATFMELIWLLAMGLVKPRAGIADSVAVVSVPSGLGRLAGDRAVRCTGLTGAVRKGCCRLRQLVCSPYGAAFGSRRKTNASSTELMAAEPSSDALAALSTFP